MSSSGSLWNAFFTCLMSFLMAGMIWFIMVGIEQMNEGFATAQMYNAGIWDSSADVDWIITVGFALVYMLPILGIAHLFITAYRRYKAEQEIQYPYYYTGAWR